MRAVVTEPMTKGELSAAMTARLPEVYARWCRTCQATVDRRPAAPTIQRCLTGDLSTPRG